MGKKKVSPFLFLAIFAAAVATAVAKVVECPSSLTSDSVNGIPFDTSSLTCQSVWADEGFVLGHEKVNESVWSFVLVTPNKNGYISVGFSDTGMMVGSSAIAGWVMSNGTGKAWQYYLGGKSNETVTPDDGNLTLPGGQPTMISQPPQLYLAFQLGFQGGEEPKENLIYALGPDGFVPETDNLLAYHRNRASTTIDYNAGASAGPSASKEPESFAGRLNSDGFAVTIFFCVVAMVVGMLSF